MTKTNGTQTNGHTVVNLTPPPAAPETTSTKKRGNTGPRVSVRKRSANDAQPTTEADKSAALDAAGDLIEAARNTAGRDSRPWNLVSANIKHGRNFRMSAPMIEKLEFVWRRHPAQFSKSDILEAALGPYLDAMIVEIDQHEKRD